MGAHHVLGRERGRETRPLALGVAKLMVLLVLVLVLLRVAAWAVVVLAVVGREHGRLLLRVHGNLLAVRVVEVPLAVVTQDVVGLRHGLEHLRHLLLVRIARRRLFVGVVFQRKGLVGPPYFLFIRLCGNLKYVIQLSLLDHRYFQRCFCSAIIISQHESSCLTSTGLRQLSHKMEGFYLSCFSV